MPRQTASAVVVGKLKRGRPRKRWRDEVGDYLKRTGIKKQTGSG
jgi:hypothetical protein